ncbi:MAG: hypothetical protein FWE42_08795 [Defluviitaleaceae bacterium]|nr:hypothetical protein [Defluviitaleaceae bacterium]
MTLTKNLGLNLLPQGIQRKRQNRRLFIMFTASQIAIVLVIIFAVRAINTLEGQAMETSRILSNRVSTHVRTINNQTP